MAAITPSTFDPLRRYVRVRLQQGVPIVDADWNEQDDVRSFELRAFLKWYVGDGVPDDNDGFRVEADGGELWVRRGRPAAPQGAAAADTALRHVGRCLVDGLDVLIEQDVRFTDQDLHQDAVGASALAARLGVPVVARLQPPTSNGTVLVYLDVWERPVTPDEDPALVLPGLGVESCARIRREWVVRVRAGSAPPRRGDADHLAGHAYLPLAEVQRTAGVAAVTDADVRDRRPRRLLTPPAHLVEDTLGVDPWRYREGSGRPPISLREAVNALLAGELPSTADLAVSSAPGVDLGGRAVAVDGRGGLVAVWQSPRSGSTAQVVAARLDLADVARGFSEVQVITTGSAHLAPTAVALPGSDLLVAYQNGPPGSPGTDVVMKRGSFGGLAAAPEQPVATTPGGADVRPFAVVVGDLVVVLSYQRTSTSWRYSRYRTSDGALLDSTPVLLGAGDSPTSDLHAAADPTGVVWCAYVSGGEVRAVRLRPSNGAVDSVGTFASPDSSGVFVVAAGESSAELYWSRSSGASPGIQTARCTAGTWGTAAALPVTDEDDRDPSAVVDHSGRTWLFATRSVAGNAEVVVRTRNPVSGDWSDGRRVVSSPASDQAPHAVLVPGHGIWVLWISTRGGDPDLYAKRIVTAV